jgi:hypothetical protein
MPRTIEQVDVARDGGLVSITQLGTLDQRGPQEPIPVEHLVAYVYKKEGGNWLGRSILRGGYKNWLIKDRLMRVQAQTIERNGMGIPDYEGAESETDLGKGLALATSLRAGEAAGVARPSGSKLRLMGVEGELPDALPVIKYHDEQIARGALAHFLNLDAQSHGSYALGASFMDFFTLSLQALAQSIANTATMHIVEDLVDLNFGEDEPAPRLVFDEIGSKQVATAAAVKTLVDAGVIHPDEVLEESSRQQYGLPPADPSTATVPPAPVGPTPAAPTQTGDMSVAAAMADPKGRTGPVGPEPVEARYNKAQLRDPHSGEWAKGGGAVRTLVDAARAVGGLGNVTYDDGSYLDWTTRLPGGGHRLEAGGADGETVHVDLSAADTVSLHSALTAFLTGDQESTGFSPGGGDGDDGYIDWGSPAPGAGRTVELGDAEGNAAQLSLDESQMQQWHQALTLSLLVEATTVKASAALAASLRRVAAKFNRNQPRVPNGPHGGEWGHGSGGIVHKLGRMTEDDFFQSHGEDWHEQYGGGDAPSAILFDNGDAMLYHDIGNGKVNVLARLDSKSARHLGSDVAWADGHPENHPPDVQNRPDGLVESRETALGGAVGYGYDPSDGFLFTRLTLPDASGNASVFNIVDEDNASGFAKDMHSLADDIDSRAYVQAAAGVDTHPGGEQLKRDPSIVEMLDFVQAAAGHDVTPGHDELHHYWTKGAGLGRWAGSQTPWTTLLANLAEEVKGKPLSVLKKWASRWFIEVFGYASGSDRNRVAHGHPPRGKRVGPG